MFELLLRWFVVMVDVSLKVLLLAGVTGLLLAGSRIRNSSLKHAAWLGVLGSLLGLPLLSSVIPAIPIPWSIPTELMTSAPADPPPAALAGVVPPLTTPVATADLNTIRREDFPRGNVNVDSNHLLQPEDSRMSMTASVPANVIVTKIEASAESIAEEPARTTFRAAVWLPIIACVWGIGSLLLLVRLALSIRVTRRLVQRSTLLQRTELPRNATSSVFGTHQALVSFRESSLIFVPLTTGWWRPCILLPTAWHTWSEDKLGHVLVHEFTHVRRGDCWTALAAEVILCLYWFHPLAWWLKRHLAALAEACCDDAAIGATGNRAAYARHLLEIASVLCEQPRRLNYAGLAMTRRSQVERRILAILDPNRPLSQRLTWGALLLLVAATVPLMAIAAALKPVGETPDGSPGRDPDQTKNPRETQVALANSGLKPNEQESVTNSPAGFRVQGQVVNPDGKPMAGVTVAIRRLQLLDRLRTLAARSQELAQVTTNADGRYEFVIPADQLPKPYLGYFNHVPDWIQIAAKFPGYGIDVKNFAAYDRGQSFDLQLTPDTVVQGRILNLEGLPVAGAAVRVLELVNSLKVKSSKSAIDGWYASVSQMPIDPRKEKDDRFRTGRLDANFVFNKNQDNLRILPTEYATATTNAEGRFELRGLGTDRLAVLEFAAPNLVRSLVNVITRPVMPVQDYYDYGKAQIFYGSKFDYVIGPSAVVEGVVLDVETKRPLVGALVTTHRVASDVHLHVPGNVRQSYPDGFITSLSDSAGRYRLEGLPPVKGNELKVYPPENEPYLVTGEIEVPDSPGLQPVTLNVELRRAVWLTGRVYDISTNKPVPASIRYSPFLTNPFLKNYPQFTDDNFSVGFNNDRLHSTDAEGRFRIPVIPGRGVIAAKLPGGGLIASYGSDVIPEFASLAVDARPDLYREITCDGLVPSDYHSIREIEPVADMETLEASLPLDFGQSVKFTFVDPDGNPVRGVGVHSLRLASISTLTDSETVTLSGFSREKPTVLIFRQIVPAVVFLPAGVRRDEKRELAKIQIVRPKTNGEAVNVQLEPLATLRCRLVDADGKPWPARWIRVTYKTDDGQTFGPYSESTSHPFPDRSFELELIPGCAYRLIAGGDEEVQYREVIIAENAVPKPGEVIDLGDVVIGKNEGVSYKLPFRFPSDPMIGKEPGQVRDDNDLKIKLAWCPAGTFQMGSPKSEEGRDKDEDQVNVRLMKGFWLGKFEVTQGEWEQVMGTTPWIGKSYVREGAKFPATYVSWDDAVDFCEKLTRQERAAGRLPESWKYTLPTEAQWEYACRAGTTTRYSFGEDDAVLSDYAWWAGSLGGGNAKNDQYAHQVGTRKANPWGLHDMHGNVWELCRDVKVDDLPGGIDPEVTAEGSGRVFRGGGCDSSANDCRSASRGKISPGNRFSSLGIRLARSPIQ